MSLRIISLILMLLVFPGYYTSAGSAEQDTGMLFGSDHAFFITAAKGWVLDNKSGVKQGLHMIFYPAGYTWSNSPVIAYGQKVSKDSKTRSVRDQVDATLEMFHSKGSPKYKIVRERSMPLPHGKKAYIYHYAGDQWGNHEAVAYVEEKNTINFLVFNARKQSDFDKYLPAFEQMIATYRSAGTSEPVDDKTFRELVKEAKRQSETPKGIEYEELVMRRAGEAVAAIMRSCSSFVGNDNVKPFEAVFRIKPDGSIVQAYVNPEAALSTCFQGLFQLTIHPPHKFESYLLHMNMKIE